MNWTQFKDPLGYPCLAGAVVASWSLTQEVVGSNYSVKTFRENSNNFAPLWPHLKILTSCE